MCYAIGIRGLEFRISLIQRYRLSNAQIMECCHTGYELGFRTFVLQGGEDGYFTDEKMTQIILMVIEYVKMTSK